MAYSPWKKRPPVLPERKRTFALKSGESLTLTLRKLGTVQQTEVYELSQRLIERYVTGDAEFVETAGVSGEGPIPFPSMDGVNVQPTETMCMGAAQLYVMQMGPAEDIAEPEAWIGFQAVEDTSDWQAVLKFTREVGAIGKPVDPKDADVPNSSGAATVA